MLIFTNFTNFNKIRLSNSQQLLVQLFCKKYHENFGQIYFPICFQFYLCIGGLFSKSIQNIPLYANYRFLLKQFYMVKLNTELRDN
jgi:hypothetical protein